MFTLKFFLLCVCVCARVGQQDVDIKLSGQFIKEIHCVFVSETNEQGEGEIFTPCVNLWSHV